MLLTPDKSICERRQKIIVSKDQREQRQHRAENPDQKYEVRHYRLDGDLVSQTTCCDFLLINDTTKKAVNSPGFRKFKDKWGSRLKYNSRTLKDTLE